MSTKHVDRLISLGFAATCNPMGAGKWRSEFAQYLAGADVVVLPDNDKPGQDHAKKVATNLSPITKRVRVLLLPGLDTGDDIIDWLDAGGAPAGLMRLADETPVWKADPLKPPGSTSDEKERTDSPKGEREKQADAIIKLALGQAELFHAPDGTAFADVRVNGHRETLRIRSQGFRLWVIRLFYEARSTVPNSDAMSNALNVLEAKAWYGSTERQVSVRVARADDKIYIDLGTPDWAAVEIDANGWRIVAEPPVRFRRAKGCLPLPRPVHGGSVTALRPFLNLKGDEDFALVVAWLLAALRNRGPYPVLVLAGEQGSAKSTLARILKRLVDPNTASLRKLADSDRDLFIAANNSYVIAYENVSTLPTWLSDALCMLATGGG